MIITVSRTTAAWLISSFIFVIAFPYSLILLPIVFIFLIAKDYNDNKGGSLINAVKNNDINKVKKLLKNGFDVNKIYADDGTALIVAAFYGYTEIAQLLVDYGAEVNKVDSCGSAAIIHAVNKGHDKIVKLLLEHGADPNAKHRSGMSIMSIAAARGFKDIINLLNKYNTTDKILAGRFTKDSLPLAISDSHEIKSK